MTYKNAVITGAASGIGFALAEALTAKGFRVILADIEIEKADKGAAALRNAGGDAIALFADHADEASLIALANASFAHLGSVDLVFANAGVGAGGAVHIVPQRNVDWVLAVNLMGPLRLARAFVPQMKEQVNPSRFVITGSEHALGLPERGGQASIYTVSKHAVLGLAETLRRDLRGSNVGVSIICPAMVKTEIWNPLRTRHQKFGGPRSVADRPKSQDGLDPTLAAARILTGLAAGEFYVFTHGADVAEVHDARAGEVSAAIERFQQRYGAGA